MARTKYHIQLSDSEKDVLTRIVCEGTESDRTVMRAKILLMSDTSFNDRMTVSKLAEKLGTTGTTIQTVRTEFATEGLEYALFRKQRKITHYNSKVSEKVRRYVISVSESEPPSGTSRWSCKKIAEAAVADGIVDSISPVTVLRIIHEDGSGHSRIRKQKSNVSETDKHRIIEE